MKTGALTVATLCIALSACTDPAADSRPDGTSAADGAPTAAVSPSAATVPAPQPASYEFYLLPRDGDAARDPRVVSRLEAHPCGPIDLVRVTSIPMNDPVFVPAFVVEFDASGKEIAKWGIPNEAEVTALEGNRLKFETEDGSFWVAPNGELEKSDPAPDGDAFTTTEGMFECPALPTFGDSEAEQCFRVKDASGTERRIAKEGVCS